MEQRQFRVKGQYNKAILREMNFGTTYISPSQLIMQLSLVFILLCYGVLLWIGAEGPYMWALPIWIVFMVGYVIYSLMGRGQYKRMSVANGGQLPEYELVFEADGIHVIRLNGSEENCYPYDLIRKIGETRNLLLLALEQDLFLVVDKRRLEDCTREELLDFLFAQCTKLKKKKLLGAKRLVIRFVILGVVCLGVLSGAVYRWLADDFAYDDYYEPSYYWAGYLTFDELAARLEGLGFDPVDEEIRTYLEESWSEYTYDELAYVNKVSDLLWEIGCGDYAEDTTDWEPSSRNVYALEEEYWYMETMYEEFFHGVAALDGMASDFAIVSENTDGVDWEEGTGVWEITFRYNGEEHTLTANVDGAWIDPCFVNDLNAIIGEGGDKQLYFGYDDYWIVYYVFYCDDIWATEFYETTGMWLHDEMYEYDDENDVWENSTLLTAIDA